MVNVNGFRSLDVLQWCLGMTSDDSAEMVHDDDGYIDVDFVMKYTTITALLFGGSSVYLLEPVLKLQHSLTTIRTNLTFWLECRRIDLSTLDYLIGHGLEISKMNYKIAFGSPAYLRYWFDSGWKISKSQVCDMMNELAYVWKHNAVHPEVVERMTSVLSSVHHGIVNEIMGWSDDVRLIEMLLKNGAKAYINDQDIKGRTPLHHACHYQHSDVVELLLNHDADVNALDDEGNTPLHIACHHNNIDIIESLVKKGSDIKICNMYGKTVLHYAAEYVHYDGIKRLCNPYFFGFNTSAWRSAKMIKDKRGRTPYDYCCNEMIRHLLKVDD